MRTNNELLAIDHKGSRANDRRSMHRIFVVAVAVLAATGGSLLSATASGATSTSISEPAGDTFHVQLDANGKALPVTIVATGFRPGTNVFAEECNGRVPSDAHWNPTLDCDAGAAPAPAIADSSGTVRFSKDDPNRVFVPFVGASPSNLFNCVAPHGAPPSNGLNSYTKCQIRVSSNNTQPTDDQVFRTVVIGAGGSGGGSSATAFVGVIVAVLVVAGIVGAVVLLRRRRPAPARRA